MSNYAFPRSLSFALMYYPEKIYKYFYAVIGQKKTGAPPLDLRCSGCGKSMSRAKWRKTTLCYKCFKIENARTRAYCYKCGKELSPCHKYGTGFCLKCSGEQRSTRPEKNVLAEELKNYTRETLADKYNVTPKTIYLWTKRYKLQEVIYNNGDNNVNTL